ncbi:MAG: hypothetical protein JW774_11380 [Candidatus Aureabacteria bacterium]|nr:hypothetical protein [Candidatus Auribacterota bacterium]
MHPDLSAYSILEHASMTLAISNSVAFEYLLKGIPAITMGDVSECPFSIFPDTMIQKVQNPFELARAVKMLLDHFFYDKEALIHYVAAVMKELVHVNYYSALFNRSDAKMLELGPEEIEKDYDALAAYLAGYLKK